MQVFPPDTPWELNYQRQANDALERAWGPSDDQWRALRPPLPQIQYLPSRFGYPGYDQRQWNVMQVFGITRSVGYLPTEKPQMGRSDGQNYNEMGAGGNEGSTRNVNYDPLGLGGVSW